MKSARTVLAKPDTVVVTPVVAPEVRKLCRKVYYGHPRGCPNWGKRPTCPPQAPLLADLLDLDLPVHCIYNAFDLARHVTKMKRKHPDWSDRQLKCCLYWQGTARAALREKVDVFLADHPGLMVVNAPEACGVDVTATMASLGIALEWPPVSVAYQVALIGTPKRKGARRS